MSKRKLCNDMNTAKGCDFKSGCLFGHSLIELFNQVPNKNYCEHEIVNILFRKCYNKRCPSNNKDFLIRASQMKFERIYVGRRSTRIRIKCPICNKVAHSNL